MIFELERAYRIGNDYDGITLAVRPVVHGIDAPTIARAVMLGMQDPVHHGIAQVQIRRRHIDFGAQRTRAIEELASLHAREEIEILFHASIAIRTILPRFRESAAGLSYLLAA